MRISVRGETTGSPCHTHAPAPLLRTKAAIKHGLASSGVQGQPLHTAHIVLLLSLHCFEFDFNKFRISFFLAEIMHCGLKFAHFGTAELIKYKFVVILQSVDALQVKTHTSFVLKLTHFSPLCHGLNFVMKKLRHSPSSLSVFLYVIETTSKAKYDPCHQGRDTRTRLVSRRVMQASGHDVACRSAAWSSVAWRGITRHNVAWHSVAWSGVMWCGAAQRGVAWCDMAWHGMPQCHVAWRGVA